MFNWNKPVTQRNYCSSSDVTAVQIIPLSTRYRFLRGVHIRNPDENSFSTGADEWTGAFTCIIRYRCLITEGNWFKLWRDSQHVWSKYCKHSMIPFLLRYVRYFVISDQWRQKSLFVALLGVIVWSSVYAGVNSSASKSIPSLTSSFWLLCTHLSLNLGGGTAVAAKQSAVCTINQ